MSTAKTDLDRDVLRIGDYVLLKDVIRASYLCAEGILSEDISAYDHTDNLLDCIFCVHLQRQYSASRDLQAFLSNYGNDVKKIEDESAKKYLMALQRGRENEIKLNDTYMRKKYGQTVSFGDIIQLFHVKSGKYLTVRPDQLAKAERENTRISLEANGNSYSWIQISPRFKIDKDGDRVISNSEMYLKVAERSNEFVHTADRNPVLDELREVNCALESTSWRLLIYQNSFDSLEKNILLKSQLVFIVDPETRCALTVHQKPLESLDEESDSNEDKVNPFEIEHAHPFGDIVLDAIDPDVIDSNFLWTLESQNVLSGGPLSWKSETVRLRHLNSGKYLMMNSTVIGVNNAILEESEGEEEGSVGQANSTIFVTSSSREHEFTQITIQEVNSTSKYLYNAKAVQVAIGGVWLERGDICEDSVSMYEVRPGSDKAVALSLIINGYELAMKARKDDSSASLSGNNEQEPLDVFSGLSARKYLQRFNRMTSIPNNDYVNTIWPDASKTDVQFFQYVADKTIYFSQGFAISVASVQLGIDKGNNRLRILRQSLLREQGTLEQVLRMIHQLIPMTEKMEKLKVVTGKRKKDKVPEETMQAIAMSQQILSKCFSIIYYSILDNPENQMYVADFMPVLLAHLNSQPLAGKCVTEMLSKNMELQETKIGTREIQIFVDKLRSSKMNAMYLALLQACCSCEGDGVDGNQGKVAAMLFKDTNDIIIHLHADHVRTSQVFWQQPSLYIPSAPIAGSPVRADSLISKGLPSLSLAWTTNSIDFSPLGLFGKLSVNVEELFKPADFDDRLSMKKKTTNGNKKKSSQDQKLAVANYFVAEMFLGAEMCLDRNYIAMHKLDELFPYEVLVAILRLNVSSNIRSAAVRLLMCLHVDRDPQAMSKIPCLTRTWSDIKKNTEPQLPFVDVSRRYVFGLLQQIISEHVRDMAGSRWDELSRHMLHMLKTLVQFNFYGTNERMKDVIGPLINALDRRKVVGSNDFSFIPSSNDDAVGGADATLGATGIKTASNEDSFRSMNEKQLTDHMEETENLLDGESSILKSCVSAVSTCCKRLYNINRSAAIGLLDDRSARKSVEGFVSPLRYSKASIDELETMVEAVDILAFTQRVIEDRNVSLLLRHFFAWESGSDPRSPGELFEQSIQDAQELTLDTGDFDNVMIDTLMFVYTPLVQSTLEVLMAHHSKRKILLENAKNVQLLASHKRERQFKLVDQMLQQLEQNAETQELWGELESDADRAVSKQTKDILIELCDICRNRRVMLEFGEEYMADMEAQDLFRNLGCFEICMKVLGLLDSVEEDEEGEISEGGKNTKEICLLCNDLLCWFFVGNAKNQEMGYSELEFFLDTLDAEINSHNVVKSIFSNNEALMRQVPHAHLANLVDKLVKEQNAKYLSLFAAISHVGDKNIVENQFEIVKLLTSPGRLQKLGCFLCPVSNPEYELKRQLMIPFKAAGVLSFEDLPNELAYHLMFLEVLAGCTVGRLNVTSVEAKVQSVFNYVDIIDSILDEDTILLAKIVLTRFLFNAVIEVELVIPGLERSPQIWRLIESYSSILISASAELHKVDVEGWSSPNVNRQKIEYILLCIMIIKGFFGAYFDPSNFRIESKKKDFKLTMSQVNQLIVSFFYRIKELHDLHSPHLTHDMKIMILETLEVLKKQAGKYIHTVVEIRASNANLPMDLIDDSLKILQPGSLISPGASPRKKPIHDGAAQQKDVNETKLIERYRQFITQLEADSQVVYKAENENVAFISILEKLPFIADAVDADVRYETLIKKLVFHIRENIKMVNNQKRLDARVTKTSIWIIRAFRTMIENRMGMSIYERDDEGGQEQDIAAAPVVNALNSCGATALCLDLIADGIDEKLQLEAIRLGVGLLFKEGGAVEVQTLMNEHLSKTNSELFFKQVRLTFQKLQAWHSWHQVIVLEEGQEPKPPDELLIVRFLQLMCEGHFLPNQDIMREQSHNRVSYNLLDDYVNYLNCLSRIPCRTSTVAAIRTAATILEVIQGPCEGNQVHFALNTELVEALNRINRAKVVNDCVFAEEVELKKISIDIFQGLLEGQGEKSQVYDRVLSVVHLDIIQMMSKKPLFAELAEDEEQIILQTECVVLLQMFCNYKPSLFDELGISRNIEDIVGSGTAMIEVIWRGDIHRRFFHVPGICSYLAKSSKDALVENVDRSNTENKLIDFLERSHEMYREVKHQQLLTEMNLSHVFSRENQNRATWITFFLTFIINALFLANYTFRAGEPKISPLFDHITTYLNAIQVAVAGFTLVLWLVVRSPVNYQTFREAGGSEGEVIFRTATDSLTIYYIVYLIIAILGLMTANYYCSLLLLDIIVKNSTTRDVLNSIITPRRQLVMALLLEVFVMYIFAFYTFFFFSADIDPYCSTMWDCFKFTLSYGFQNGGGVADSFVHTNGARLILDLAFFVVVLVVLLNVFLGMIIDTFSSLRADKIERLRDTQEVCFVCGIEKQIFDRASDEPDGFKTHVKIDHNMWNYMYFIFLLWEQDRDDDDGLEQYVRRAIDANEITWFPMNKAMRLDRVATHTEALQKDLKDSVRNTCEHLQTKLDDCRADVTTLMAQFMSTLRQEVSAEDMKLSDIFVSMQDEDESAKTTSRSRAGSANYSNAEVAKNISIAVKSVDGLNFSVEQLKTVSCRIIGESGMFATKSNAVEEKSGTVLFDVHNSYAVFDNVSSKDRRAVQIQVIEGDATKIGRAMHFLGHIEIYAKDLLSEKEKFNYDCKFDRQVDMTNSASIDMTGDQSPIRSQCTLHLVIHCTPAIEGAQSSSPQEVDDASESSQLE